MLDSQSVTASCLWGGSEELKKAFWPLWKQYQDYLYRCCLRWMGGNPTDAEDALSLAMLKAWDKLPEYAERITNLRAWLTRLTYNLCVDIQRERRRSAIGMESIEEIAVRGDEAMISSFDSPEYAILSHELRWYIRRGIDALPSKLRTPFILRYYHQISTRDIAQQLELSLNNVYKRIQRAREILQLRMRRYLSGLDDSLLDSSKSNTARDNFPPTPVVQGKGLGGLDQPNSHSIASKLSCKRGKSVLESSQSDETMISDSQAAMTMKSIGETINYQVTATCLQTLPHAWYCSLSTVGWS